jgi:hypothetical protein
MRFKAAIDHFPIDDIRACDMRHCEAILCVPERQIILQAMIVFDQQREIFAFAVGKFEKVGNSLD